MTFKKYKPSDGTFSLTMTPLNFSRKALQGNHSTNSEIVARPVVEDADIDMREVYFLIMHFLSNGPCKRTSGQMWNELLEHDLLPRRYHASYSRNGAHSGNEDDNGFSLPLSYADLVSRYPHIETNHLVKLLKQLILCCSPPHGLTGGCPINGIEVSSLLGSGTFSLLRSDRDRELKKANHFPRYLRWPHMQANQVQGLSLREIGGGFTKHCRGTSVRAACYAIAKPATMVEKMQSIKKLRGHRNAVYCAIFDRSGRYVITGSDDRLVKIWSMETAFCLSSCRGHEGDITDLAVSSNNTLIASASNDFIIRTWRLPDGVPISVLKGHTGAVTAIAFSPRPSSIYHLLSSSDDGTCRIWDARYSNSSLRVYVPKPPDGFPGTSGNPSSGQQVHQILCCAYNANGTVFVTGSSDTYARVWNACRMNPADSSQPNHEIDLLSGHENDVNYVQFSGCAVTSKCSTADISKEDKILKFKNSWFTHDNIVTCSRDGSAIIWIPRSRRSHGKVGRWTRAYHLRVPPPPMPPQPPRGGPRKRSQPTPRGVNMIVWSLDNRFVLAAIMDCRICVWNASDGSLVHSLIGHRESTFVLDVHPFNPRIAMSAGYDGKTIIWDIWEGTPVRIYEMGHFKLVDGKFSPDGTSIVLSDEVGQIFVIATGQGESQKDAKYDQFFLGDYRPLIQDVNGNTLDQETQLQPHMRNMQDLLCDSSMIPYPEPYQNMFQRRRLGALGFEWRPPSLALAVGPSNNINAGDYIMPIVDLERWVESLESRPEFVDAIDWEHENEVQSDDTDSEYNVTEEFSSGREQVSLSISSSENQESSAEGSEDNHNVRGGLRRSKRKQSKLEVEITTTTSGRRVKRGNLDEHERTVGRGQRKRRTRNGKLALKKKSSKSKPHRPQRRAAKNARTFLFDMGEASLDDEDDFDSDTYTSEDVSSIPDSIDQSNDSDGSFFNPQEPVVHGKEIQNDEKENVSGSSPVNEVQSIAAPKRRLVLRLPVHGTKKSAFSDNTIANGHIRNDCSSVKMVSSGDDVGKISLNVWEPGQSSRDNLHFSLSQNVARARIKEGDHSGKIDFKHSLSTSCKDGKVKWGEVKLRTAKRMRTGHALISETCPMGYEDLHTGTSNTNGHHAYENDCQTSTHSGNKANGHDPCTRDFQNEEWPTVIASEAVLGSENLESAMQTSLPHDQVSPNADALDRSQVGVASNGIRTVTDQHVIQNFNKFSDTKDLQDTKEMRRIDAGKSSLFYDTRCSGPSQDAENNAVSIHRKLRVTSKRSIYEPSGSSSRTSDAEEKFRSFDDDALIYNNTMQSEHGMVPSIPEEDPYSTGSSEHDVKKFNSWNHHYNRTKSSRCRRSMRQDTHSLKETNSKYENNNAEQNANFVGGLTDKLHYTRSSARIVTDEASGSLTLRCNHGSLESGSRFLFNGFDLLQQDDRKRTSKLAVGLRSARNRREKYNICDLSSIGKRNTQHPVKKASWLMLSEHEEGYRYIPQLGDEVAYLRQGHAEFLEAMNEREPGPWRTAKLQLRAVEYCKVASLQYSTVPGSGESCCKLTLKFIDPSSCAFGSTFKLTLPELAEIPDFLVERTIYDASIERNWSNRDKCKVWWRDADGLDGSWWEGRIISTKAKSLEFPDSPWERYVIHYKDDSSDDHRHSPWELHDTAEQWVHPCIDDLNRSRLLAAFYKIEKTSVIIQRLNQVSQKSDFLNRFPVPLSFDLIKRRLETNYYRTLAAVEHDAKVMLSNAESYFVNSAECVAKLRKLADSINRVLKK